MASNLEECPTGILIDFIEDITASNSPHFNEKEQDDMFNGKAHKIESSRDKEETSGYQASVMNNPSRDALGDELTKKYERDAWSGWRTPSPTSMNMINEEALRIVDQLDTTLEISLWDEEFPLSSNLEEDCSEEYYESEVLSHNVASNSLNSNTLCDVNVIKRDIVIENELVAKCSSTSEGDFSSIEKNVITKETCSLENPSVLTDNFVSETNRTNSCVNENTGHTGTTEGSSGSFEECSYEAEIKSGVVEGSSGTGERGSGNVKENSGITSGSSGIYKKSSSRPNESSDTSKRPFIKEHCFDTIEENSDVFEGNFDTLGEISGILEGSSEVLEGSSGALEGSSGALEGSSGALEGSSGTPGESSVTLEKNCTANKKCCTSEKYGNASEEKSCDKIGTKKVCDIIEASCLLIEENSFITKDNSPVTEEASVVNSSRMEKCSNVGVSNSITDMKQKHLSLESIINENGIKSTPSKSLNMKSKFGKVFNRSSLKTPLNHNKAKENIFQESKDKNALPENKICKIGSSAKSILGESNVNGSEILTSKPNIKTPLSKRILGKIPFARGENKLNMNMSQSQTKQTIKQPNAQMKSTNSLQCPASSLKTPLYKSNSVMDTPNLVKPIRRSNSFQTPSSIENSNQFKREKSFVAVSHLKTLNSRMSLHQTARIGNELKTPLKSSSILPKHTSNAFFTPSNTKSCAKASQIVCPSFGSALKQINTPIPGSKPLGFKRPVSRFCSRLELPSPLPKAINDNIPRRLFPDNTPKKRFN